MGCFFLYVYDLYHFLVNKVKVPGDIACYASFFSRVFIISGSSIYGRGFTDAAKRSNSCPDMDFISYFSLHLCCLDNQIFLFLVCLFVFVVVVVVVDLHLALPFLYFCSFLLWFWITVTCYFLDHFFMFLRPKILLLLLSLSYICYILF